ncbi:unnamed protein product, partial [marine sediment metagenome]
MLDKYWNGNINRVNPEAPVPLVDIHIASTGITYAPGGAGNVA